MRDDVHQTMNIRSVEWSIHAKLQKLVCTLLPTCVHTACTMCTCGAAWVSDCTPGMHSKQAPVPILHSGLLHWAHVQPTLHLH